MTTTIPKLPEEVLTVIKVAEDAIRAEQTAVITEVERARIDRVGRVAARRNGEDSYMPGHVAVMARAFAHVSGPVPARERTCQCAACDDVECDASCEPCENGGCEQCHESCDGAGDCCGWCSDCEEHHSDDSDHSENTHYILIGRYRQLICTECEHVCGEAA